MNEWLLREKLQQFFIEDIGTGDLSTKMLAQNQIVKAQIICKEEGVFCGSAVVEQGFLWQSTQSTVTMHVRDGECVKVRDVIATITAPVGELLSRERVVLNLIGRMSGISTATSLVVRMIENSGARICDTRKTTPGLKMFEKYAVQCGGGYNHRFGLYDGVMLKENHIVAAGGITQAVQQCKQQFGHMVNVEVEVESEEQWHEALAASPDVIMIDNQSPETISKWLKSKGNNHIVIEASGGITEQNVLAYARSGVDYISLGALTHSVKPLDLSLLVEGAIKGGNHE
ncbi:MAG: carboxylating nicotinate-nucleotide diphosphorylase [Bacilli bacterium]